MILQKRYVMMFTKVSKLVLEAFLILCLIENTLYLAHNQFLLLNRLLCKVLQSGKLHSLKPR